MTDLGLEWIPFPTSKQLEEKYRNYSQVEEEPRAPSNLNPRAEPREAKEKQMNESVVDGMVKELGKSDMASKEPPEIVNKLFAVGKSDIALNEKPVEVELEVEVDEEPESGRRTHTKTPIPKKKEIHPRKQEARVLQGAPRLLFEF